MESSPPSPRNTNLLVIVARMPVAGATKTRLGAEIGHGAAAALYAGFVADLAAAFRPTPDYDVVWAYTPEGADFPGLLRSLVGVGVATIPQSGGRLNERLTNIFRWAEGAGYARTAILASDSPQLRPADVAPAFRLLRTAQVVLGRVSDGGYYLIGMQGARDLLLHVPMGTADAAHAVEVACRERGLAYAELPPAYDIDVAADLPQLISQLAADPGRSPATWSALRAIGVPKDG